MKIILRQLAFHLVVLLVLLLSCHTTQSTSTTTSGGCGGGGEDDRPQNTTRAWLTVSSVVSTETELVRALEIHWLRPAADPKPHPGDYVAIVSIDNATEIRRYMLNGTDNVTESNVTTPNIILTDLSFPMEKLNSTTTLLDKYQSTQMIMLRDPSTPAVKANRTLNNCLHFYVIYFSAKVGDVVSVDCIRLNYQWMKDNFDRLQGHTLLEMMLPGTHDATSFEPYSSTYEGDVITRFQYTQDESVFAQLAYGVRYLDLRVGAFNQSDFDGNFTQIKFDEQLWFVHDIERNHINLTDGLRQIRRFMEQTSHEVVIADFHRFVTGFDGNDDWQAVNRRLVRLYKEIVAELGDYLIPYRSSLNLGDLVRSGRRVLLGYQFKGDRRQYFDSPLLWPNVQHLWAQTDEFEQLERYIEGNVCKEHSYLTSVMAELTPSFQGVLFFKYHGLRELAQQVNVHYDHWFRQRWWRCANIVAADFFLGSDIVEIAVDVNRRRFVVAAAAATPTTNLTRC